VFVGVGDPVVAGLTASADQNYVHHSSGCISWQTTEVLGNHSEGLVAVLETTGFRQLFATMERKPTVGATTGLQLYSMEVSSEDKYERVQR
jgi:hypothetical protein